MYTVMSVHSQLSRYAVAGLPPAFQRQCQMEGFKCLKIISTAPYTAVAARVSIWSCYSRYALHDGREHKKESDHSKPLV